MIALESRPDGTVLPVRVRAGARRTGIAGEHDCALRVDVSAAPEKGKANRAVAEVLADLFGLTKSSVQLLTGSTSQQKRFLLVGINLEAAQRRLQMALKQ